nr:rhodanese-like domain-containing protein [Rhizohabitans arisaemae]
MTYQAMDAASVPDGAYLLDVREHDEWQAGHAPTAVHIPLGELGVRLDEVPKDRGVYLICRSGVRSAHAAAHMAQGGWTAINVEGGMQAWAAAGRPMISDTQYPPFVA